MPHCEHFLSIASAAGSEVMFQVRTSNGEVASSNMTQVIAELVGEIRDLRKLIEAVNIAKADGLGGAPSA